MLISLSEFRLDKLRDSSTPFLFCSTGRLYWKKGFDYALLAMKELKNRGHAFRYEIIGEGIERLKLIFMAHDLGLQDEIVFLGSLPGSEVKSRLEKCDIYVLPSLSEGISNAVLEAMAMQLPVVSTRAGWHGRSNK
ncbi:MAG: glycosyltransferase [Cytophagales bacterium]|nr:glycosyltransferase [Cytophagales bacterium]